MADVFIDKPHPATPRRRQQARSQGHVAKSQDLVSALVMTGGLLALWITGLGFGHFLIEFTTQQLGQPSWQPITASTINDTWLTVVTATGRNLAPVLAIVMCVAIAANLSQTGFLFLPQRIAVDFNRILPTTGLRRWISAGNIIQLHFGLCKTLVVVTVALFGLWSHRLSIFELTSQGPQMLVRSMFQLVFTISLQISFALVILALIDYLLQRWQTERSLRLSDAEMREELRHMQKDPQAVKRRQSSQAGLAPGQLQQMVLRCDMILFDGNSIAVALQCDPSTTSVPRVITKGEGRLAEKIVTFARQGKILLQQEPQLTRTIYREAEAAQQISPSRYQMLARSFHAAQQDRQLDR